ncbi:MAG: hypothetical protein EOP84_05170 [Verrucomicrobiaceae bacterium]|nr:MAG: hypothetical protein EOP84_05170 [Verrucomicrobiaceae bacterium]
MDIGNMSIKNSLAVLLLLLVIATSGTPIEILSISQTAGGYSLRLGQEDVNLSEKQFDALLEGRKIESVTKLLGACRKLIAPGRPVPIGMISSKDSNLPESTVEKLAFAITSATPEGTFVLSPNSERSAENIDALKRFIVSSPQQIAAIVPDPRHSVTDGKAIQNRAALLKKAGLVVKTFRASDPGLSLPPDTKGVIVLTGHSDQYFETYVKALGRTGAFSGRFVIFNTCQTDLTRVLAQRILTEFGATALYRYEGKVNSKQVSMMATDLAKRVSNRQVTATQGESYPFEFMTWIQDFSRTLGLRGIWTTALLHRTSVKTAHETHFS